MILILLIAVVIFIVYHKIMNVWYFSFKGFVLEIITILMISSFLSVVLVSLLGSILTTIGTILGKLFMIILFVAKWIIIIGIVFLVGLFIKSIFLKFKNENDVNLNNESNSEGEKNYE